MRVFLSLCLLLAMPFMGYGISVIRQDFIFDYGPTRTCHACSIVEIAPGTIVAAWAGGEGEYSSDYAIWMARFEEGSWSEPLRVATGGGVPCLDPVLTRLASGELLLFYKMGFDPAEWRTFLLRSRDGGLSWLRPEALPDGILGPIKGQPWRGPDGSLVCGSSKEDEVPNRVYVEVCNAQAGNWRSCGAIPLGLQEGFGVIQPVLFEDSAGNVRMLCRPRHGLRVLCESVSSDHGISWSPIVPTHLPNPDSSVDVTALRDGRLLLVYNHCAEGRDCINLAVSHDGQNWEPMCVLEEVGADNVHGEDRELSYPAILQAEDGSVHVTYTWHRERIRHVILGGGL